MDTGDTRIGKGARSFLTQGRKVILCCKTPGVQRIPVGRLFLECWGALCHRSDGIRFRHGTRQYHFQTRPKVVGQVRDDRLRGLSF